MKSLLPKNELRRIEKLRIYEVLDAASENAFERIVRMTARIFAAPMAAISLVDEFRQWYKASCGLECSEISRDVSFCALTILQDEVFVVPDAAADFRFAANPLVASPIDPVRFYAGAPLRTPEGCSIGTLCIMDSRPRSLTDPEQRMLKDLAACVVNELSLRRVAGDLQREVDGRKSTEKVLTRQHRLLQRLSGSLEVRIAERTRELVKANDALLEEITQREALEIKRALAETALHESERRFRQLVEQAGDAFFVCDMEGRFVDVNQTACDSLGYVRAELLGMPVSGIEMTFRPEVTLPRWPERKLGAALTVNGVHRRKDGTTFPVESRISPVLVNGRRFMLALVRDITDRRRAEAAIHHAREEAEKANAAKSEFLSRMSHELRTPLNAILGFGQILQKDAEGDAMKACATHVVTAGRHLLSLINEVLDIARIEAGGVTLSMESVNVGEVIAGLISLMRPLAAERGITVEEAPQGAGGSACVVADHQRFRQVLMNLLSNAVKYSPPSGRVVIDCRCRAGDTVRVCVRDSGLGFAEDQLERLWVAFDRLGAEKSDVQGTGLGLSLSKRLIEAMGGSIGAVSTPGRGSLFWVELPRAKRAESPAATDAGTMVSSASLERDADGADGSLATPPTRTILYIEDNPSNLELIKLALSKRGELRLLTAERGSEGIEIARAAQPDLILLDLNLPDIPGIDVLKHLKSDKSTRGIPVAVLSADATSTTIKRLLAAGAQDYLTKPIVLESLWTILPRGGPSKSAPLQSARIG